MTTYRCKNCGRRIHCWRSYGEKSGITEAGHREDCEKEKREKKKQELALRLKLKKKFSHIKMGGGERK